MKAQTNKNFNYPGNDFFLKVCEMNGTPKIL